MSRSRYREQQRLTPVERERFVAKMAAIKEASRKLEGPSLAERVAALPAATRKRFFDGLSPIDALRLLYAWQFWRRPKQLAPAWKWDVWLILAGRSFGKSRTAAEWIWWRIATGHAKSIAFVGPDLKEIHRYMVGGQKKKARNGSGILDVVPPWVTVIYKEQKQEIHFPDFGAVIYLCSAEDRELRGANLDTIWGDEICKWKYAQALIDNINLTLREKGPSRPQVLYTTTPRPVEYLRQIMLDPGTHTTHGFSRENTRNLHEAWLPRMERLMGGTRQGAQELEGEVLGDNPDSLFSQSLIDAHRVDAAPLLRRVVVAVDPAVSVHRKSDETGIVVVGIDHEGELYVLADLTGRMHADAWGDAVIRAYLDHGASAIVVERDRAGDLVAANVRASMDRNRKGTPIRIVEVKAQGPKESRAEPISTLYEKGRVHHVGRLARLEDEMTEWQPGSGVSPRSRSPPSTSSPSRSKRSPVRSSGPPARWCSRRARAPAWSSGCGS